MHVQFSGLRPPRNPLLRLLLALAGVALLGFFTVFGLVIAAGVMAVLGVRSLLRQLGAPARAASSPQRPTPPGVIEGEYRVIRHH